MRAGLLNEVIKIYRPTITKNNYGEEIETLKLHTTTRTQVLHSGGSRSLSTDEITYPYMKTFIIRYYVDVCENDIIEFQDKRYQIQSIDKSRALQQQTILTELIND